MPNASARVTGVRTLSQQRGIIEPALRKQKDLPSLRKKKARLRPSPESIHPSYEPWFIQTMFQLDPKVPASAAATSTGAAASAPVQPHAAGLTPQEILRRKVVKAVDLGAAVFASRVRKLQQAVRALEVARARALAEGRGQARVHSSPVGVIDAAFRLASQPSGAFCDGRPGMRAKPGASASQAVLSVTLETP